MCVVLFSSSSISAEKIYTSESAEHYKYVLNNYGAIGDNKEIIENHPAFNRSCEVRLSESEQIDSCNNPYDLTSLNYNNLYVYFKSTSLGAFSNNGYEFLVYLYEDVFKEQADVAFSKLKIEEQQKIVELITVISGISIFQTEALLRIVEAIMDFSPYEKIKLQAARVFSMFGFVLGGSGSDDMERDWIKKGFEWLENQPAVVIAELESFRLRHQKTYEESVRTPATLREWFLRAAGF